MKPSLKRSLLALAFTCICLSIAGLMVSFLLGITWFNYTTKDCDKGEFIGYYCNITQCFKDLNDTYYQLCLFQVYLNYSKEITKCQTGYCFPYNSTHDHYISCNNTNNTIGNICKDSLLKNNNCYAEECVSSKGKNMKLIAKILLIICFPLTILMVCFVVWFNSEDRQEYSNIK